MAYRDGRCMNDLYCSLASAKQTVQVPVGSLFVCPQCGKELVVPPAERKRNLTAPVLIAVGGLVVGAGALFAAGSMIGGKAPAGHATAEPPVAGTKPRVVAPVQTAQGGTPAPVVAVATPPATAGASPAPGSAVPTASVAASAAVPATAEPRAAVSAAPPASTSAPAVAASQPPAAPAQAYAAAVPPPPRSQPAPKPAPAMQLAMLQTPSPAQQAAADAQARAKAAAEAKRAELAQAAADRQKKQLLLQAQEQKRKLLAAKEAEAAERAKQEETARATQEAARQAALRQAAADAAAREAARAARPAPPPKLAAAPAGPTRGFSSRPLSGGTPVYPAAYEAEGRPGRVTVACLISASGTPSGCHVVGSQGGVAFNNAALNWLRSGEVRFAPILHNGEAVSEEHSWSISFQPQ